MFDTDVNGPALAEFKCNNPPNTTSCAYITVGTGVGVGLVVNSKTVHGLLLNACALLFFSIQAWCIQKQVIF